MALSLAKVMGLQSRQKQGPKFLQLHQEHDSRHGQVIQHDRNDNISHTTYVFWIWKSVAHVLGKLVGFLWFTHNDDYVLRGDLSLWVHRKNQHFFAYNMSYRLTYSKPICGMTHITTVVMLNHFSTSRTMFLE